MILTQSCGETRLYKQCQSLNTDKRIKAIISILCYKHINVIIQIYNASFDNVFIYAMTVCL